MSRHKDFDPVVRHVLKRPLPNNVKIMWEGMDVDDQGHTTVFFVDLPASLYTMLVLRDVHGELDWEEYRLDTALERLEQFDAWQGIKTMPIH